MRPIPPPPLRQVLIDTSAYVALADPRDDVHAPAVATLRQMTARRLRQITTNFVPAETHALLLARAGRQVAAQALWELDHGATLVVRVRPGDEQRAREIIYQYDDKDFSLTDATCIAVMERLHLTHAFSYDRDFQQFGFAVLREPTDL